jgi:hypothetical protein
MEHRRWMGERLAKGWRYGPRDDCREQRTTFVPWAELTEDERRYDRQQLPSLIVARREQGFVAHVAPRAGATGSDHAASAEAQATGDPAELSAKVGLDRSKDDRSDRA